MREELSGQVRSVLAGVLGTVAQGLSATSRAVEQASWLIRPRDPGASRGDQAPSETPQSDPRDEVADAARAPADEAAEAEPAPAAKAEPAPAPEDAARARTAETHAAALAARPAAEIIEAVPGLSTDQLRSLYEYESAHKGRKTVLHAIERAAEPPGGS